MPAVSLATSWVNLRRPYEDVSTETRSKKNRTHLEVLVDGLLDQQVDLLGNSQNSGGGRALVGGAGDGAAGLGDNALTGPVERSVL